MSSRVIIRTLKFCTSSVTTVCSALDILKLPCKKTGDNILVQDMSITVNGDNIYVNVFFDDSKKKDLFLRINSKIAEMERQLRVQSINRNKQEQERAFKEDEAYRVRQLKREEERLAYERQKLELEQRNFLEAKKASVIAKAKEKGYSVQESIEDGVIKLKLVKRIY